MDKLNQTANVLNSIDTVVTKLLKRAVVLMKQLEQDDNDIVDDLISEFSDLDSESANLALKEISLELIKDANIIRNEINVFADCIANNKDISEIPGGMCDFFKEVWLGDSYGESGIDGLKELEKDMKQQLSRVNKATLLKMADDRVH